MWGDCKRVFIEVSIDRLNEWDLGQLIEDAVTLGSEYARRERHVVASSFSALATLAYGELEDREKNAGEPDWTQHSWLTVPVEFDPTSSTEHNKDDLGTVIAHAMVMAERTDISDDLADMWFQIIRHLARERDRLRGEGVLL